MTQLRTRTRCPGGVMHDNALIATRSISKVWRSWDGEFVIIAGIPRSKDGRPNLPIFQVREYDGRHYCSDRM